MKTSPTQRTLALLRKEGWTVAIVERWNAYAKIRQDLFGCIDLVAMRGNHLMGVQATSGANHSKRRVKAQAEPRLAEWLGTGSLFMVISWSKLGGRGKRKLWEARREYLGLVNGQIVEVLG